MTQLGIWDAPPEPPAAPPARKPGARTPRYYQEECDAAIVAALYGTPSQDAVRSCLVVMATGLGKTQIFSERARRTKGRVLVIAHRDELITQARDSLSLACGEYVGTEKAEARCGGERLVVSSIQTMHRRLDKFKPDHWELIVIDEAHRAPAESYCKVMRHFSGAKILGVTATPDRADEKAMGAVFDSVAYVMDIENGIEAGYLVPVKGVDFAVDVDLSDISTSGGDYAQGELDEAMLKVVESVVDQALRFAGNEQCIVFTPGVKSAHAMCERANLERPGCSIAIDGGTEPLLRKSLVQGFKSRKYQFLWNCFDMKTEVLTRRGWASGYCLPEGEDVATFNMTTGAIEWQPAMNPFVKRHVGGLVRLSNQSIDARVTPEHRMVVRSAPGVRWKIRTAEDLLAAAGPYELPVSGHADHPGVGLSDAELQFIGLFLADGSLNEERASVEICQSLASLNGPAMACEIERILTACGFDWKAHRYEAASGFKKERRPFVRYRIPKGNIGGALTRSGWHRLAAYLDKYKEMPAALSACTSHQFEQLVYGMWVGDGTKSTRERATRRPGYAIASADFRMVDALQAMAVTRGFASSATWRRQTTGGGEICMLRLRRRDSIRTNNHAVPTSGGNPARVETATGGSDGEDVWCCSTKNTTVVVRRNGRVLIAGQCNVATEGFDAPEISIVAIARPTKSRALFAQMVGRGTRVLPGSVDHIPGPEGAEARRAAIAASAKPHMTILNFVEREAHITLRGPVTAVDVLGGNYTEDEVKEAKRRQAGMPDEDIRTSLKVARNELAAAAKALKAARARVTARTEAFDPFSALGIDREDAISVRFSGRAATPKQLDTLEKFGLARQDIQGLDFRAASRLLGKTFERMDKGYASLKQLKALSKWAPVPDTLPFNTARKAMDYVAGECGFGRRQKVDAQRLESILRGG